MKHGAHSSTMGSLEPEQEYNAKDNFSSQLSPDSLKNMITCLVSTRIHTSVYSILTHEIS